MTAINSNHEIVRPQSDTTHGAMPLNQKLVSIALIVTALAVVTIIYFRSLGTPPLLDEQYMLTWLKNLAQDGAHASQREFMTWHGVNPTDLSGVLSNTYLRIAHFFAGGHLFMMRFYNLVMHLFCAAVVGVIAVRLTGRMLLAAVAATLFIVCPLSMQAVTWLGGTGVLLSTTLVLTSMLCYLVARHGGFRWQWLAASAALFFSALLSSANAWYAVLAIILCELLAVPTTPGFSVKVAGDDSDKKTYDFSSALMAPLIFFVLAAAFFAGSGLGQTMWMRGITPDFDTANLLQGIKKVLLPVNEEVFRNAGKQFFWVGLFTVPAGIGLTVALLRRNTTWMSVLFCLLWLLTALLPSMGHLATTKTLIGDAAYYPALAPLAVLLAIGFSGLGSLTGLFTSKTDSKSNKYDGLWDRLNAAIIAIATVLLSFTYIRMLWKEHDFMRATGKTVAKLQEQGKALAARSAAPYVVITTMPKTVSLSKLYDTKGVALFDGATMLMSSPDIPGGRLKDALRKGTFVNNSARWQEAMRQLVELDLHMNKNLFGNSRSAAQIADIAQPHIIHNALAKFDTTEQAIVLTSHAPAGPILTIDGMGLSPLDGDFLYMDAKVRGVTPGAPANIEFYWQTREMDFYDSRLRKLTLKADTQAPGFVRYYIPLRTIGWTTNGPILKFTLGFPAGSTASIREMGVLGSEGLIPSLGFVPPAGEQADLRFANGFYKFPTTPELGLAALPPRTGRLTLNYDASAMHGATGVTIEVSLPNKPFGNPNAPRLSGSTWKKIPIDKPTGAYELSLEDVPTAGVVYVRAIAMDHKHDFVGFFSDDLGINVSR